jgi:hypothetical protein
MVPPKPDLGGRTRLLEHAERLGWPAVRVGRLRVREGETHWRQMTTLCTGPELLRLAAALALTTGGTSRPARDLPSR